MTPEEEPRGTAVGGTRPRSGPRHALPRKPLLNRLQVPAGRAIAVAAMPTAVLMGMGFAPTLARAEDKPSARNLTVDEYQDCVEALKAAEQAETEASASPPPAATSEAESDGKQENQGSWGDGSSPDSGSGEEPEPEPSASTSAPGASSAEDTSTEAPAPSESGGSVLDWTGDVIEGVFAPDGDPAPGEPKATGFATSSASVSEDPSDTAGAAEQANEDEAVADAFASATPSPPGSVTVDPGDCPAATDDKSGLEQGIPPLADDPWYLEASSLLLKGADYQGVVKVRTANGTVKEVLKYVVSDGSDIGDLHQIAKDEQAGKTYHVKAGKGTTSTIRDGTTVMYTESVSGNLLGLIPVTFSPEHPPPLNTPLVYFTEVTVVQAAQFGGTLSVPGMHQYTTG